MLEELRIRGLGVIDEAVLPLGPGLTVVTGETGAGKTMVVTGLMLLFGARADAARVRTGAEQASRRRPAAASSPTVAGGASGCRDAGGAVEGDPTTSGRRARAAPGGQPPAAGRAPTPAEPPRRSRCWASWPSTWSPSTARATSSASSARRRSGPPSTASPASTSPRALRPTSAGARPRRRWPTGVSRAAELRREADLLAARGRRDRGGGARTGRARRADPHCRPASATPRR